MTLERIARGLCFTLLILLAGCASGSLEGRPPAVEDPTSAATLVVIRPYNFVASGTPIRVTFDGVEVCSIGPGEHVIFPLPEGRRIVGLSTWSSSSLFTRAYQTQVFDAQRQQAYYFRIGPHDAINPVPGSIGRQLVTETTAIGDNAWRGQRWEERTLPPR